MDEAPVAAGPRHALMGDATSRASHLGTDPVSALLLIERYHALRQVLRNHSKHDCSVIDATDGRLHHPVDACKREGCSSEVGQPPLTVGSETTH